MKNSTHTELFRYVVIITALVCNTLTSATAQNLEIVAMDAAIVRSEAVFSGQFQYSVVSGAGDGKQFDREPETYDITFSGPSWKRGFVYDAAKALVSYSESLKKSGVDSKKLLPLTGIGESIVVSHNGRLIEYQSSPQHNGTIRKTGNAKSGEEAINKLNPLAPQFLATFWYSPTLKYVTDNKARAKRKGTDKIDGQEVVIYEWTVKPVDIGNAFHSVNELTQEGGILRVYIAPGLGHMIPKIEHVGVSGKVGALFEGSDFIKCNGMYFPQKASIQYIKSKGQSFRIEYRIKHVERINEAIPESEFVLELPVGTEFHDGHDNKNSKFFTVNKESPIPEGLNTVVLREGDRNTHWFRSWKGAVAIGVGLGVIGLLVLFVSKRVQTRRVAS